MASDTAHRRAWVTLLTNDRYLPGLLVLDHTMKQVGTKYPLVVLTTPSFPDERLALLQALGMRTKRIELLEPRGEMMLIAERFKDTWSKLQAFALTEYERVVLLDCDMSVLSPIDSLLSDDSLLPSPSWIAAAHSCVCNPLKQDFYLLDCVPSNCAYTHAEHHSGAPPPVDLLPTKRTYGLLNSGLVVLCPPAELYNSIVHHLHTSPTVAQMALPDQDLLGEVFDGRWVPLEWRFNAIKTFRWVHPELWFAAEEVDGKEGRRLEGRERNEQTGNGVAVLHYIVEKPWLDPLPPSSPDLETHRWWWADWRRMLAAWDNDARLSGYVEGVTGLVKGEAEP
ncbi:glycosyl transferase [Rhodotorula diobovata]|uniref:Glycosyl transferase n=1 Tax=Rhodotorula diobovata TaxID=5288 RepID=A0A5C5FUG5_9BASI|nr:glycosyl transferase [Rhodotorula diobovata]